MKYLLFVITVFIASQLFAQTILSGGAENDIIGRIVKLPDGRLYAVVERNPDWATGDFYGTFSSDNGDTWGALSPIITETGNQSTLSLVVTSDDSLRLYYASDENGQYKIFTTSSLDGISWGNKYQLDLGWTASTGVYDPHVMVESDTSLIMIYIKLGGGAYISRYTLTNGWDQNMQLVQSGAYRAGIAKWQGEYIAAYHRNIGGNYDIHIRTSSDLVSWTSEVDLTSNGNSHDAYIGLLDNNELAVFYAKVEPSNYNIRSRTTNDLQAWSSEYQYTNDNTHNTQPSFFVDQNELYLSYTHAIDYNTNNDIYFERIVLQTAYEIHSSDQFEYFVRNDYLYFNLNDGQDKVEKILIYDILGKKISEYRGGMNKVALPQTTGSLILIKILTEKDRVITKTIYR